MRMNDKDETRLRIEKAWEATPLWHRETLLGERKAGSKWGRDFTLDDWRVLEPQWRIDTFISRDVKQPGSTYLTCLPTSAEGGPMFPKATLGAWPWLSLTELEQKCVEEVKGPHGPELQLESQARIPAIVATLILGLHEGVEIVFTLHPGPALRPGVERDGCTAVKIVEPVG